MVKFKITPERAAAVLAIPEYYNILAGVKGTALATLLYFVLSAEGEYIVRPVYDGEGDIEKFENIAPAMRAMSTVPLLRLASLEVELRKACKDILNPPNGGGLTPPPPSEAEPPPPG